MGLRHIHLNCSGVETGVYLITLQKKTWYAKSPFSCLCSAYTTYRGQSLLLYSFVMLFACLSTQGTDKSRDLATYLNDS